MVFSSLYFLFLYLPIVLFLYYITPLKWRNLLLLLVNLVFYAWGEPRYVFLMLAGILLNYLFGLGISRAGQAGRPGAKKAWLALAVGYNLLALFFFKYAHFAASLLDGASWHAPDHYFILKDFMPYQEARLRAMRDYRKDPRGYARKCLRNRRCSKTGIW